MNLINTYELIYTGLSQPQHLLRAVKTDTLSNAIGAADNARLAEYFLRILNFDSQTQERSKRLNIPDHELSSTRLVDYITHVHQAKSDEIRGRFHENQLDDQDASNLLFGLTLKQEIDKLANDKEFTLSI